jgi:hypothetical protein
VRIVYPRLNLSIAISIVALRSKAHVIGRLIAGIVSSNTAEGMDVQPLEFVVCVGSGFCDGLITRSEES